MYNYETEKQSIFTDEGQKTFLQIRDKVHKHLNLSGAFMMENIINGIVGGTTWFHMACVDRLQELGEITELTSLVRGQDRVFVKK